MTARRHREQLRVEIAETERMLTLIGDHPLMSVSYRERLEELRRQLDATPIDTKEPKVILLFSGKPVLGSLGIDAEFLGKAVIPFQKMVQADLAQRGYGKVGTRGQIKSADEARLFLTALPRGSFGIELAKLENSSLFEEDLLSDSLVHVSKLIESSAKSDEDFAASLEHTSQRVITELGQFLRAVSSDKAGVSIESGGIKASLEVDEVQAAFNRVSAAKTAEERITIKGVLKGILLESWKFDFLDDNQNIISGPISNDISEEEVTNFIGNFFNRPCIATFQKTTVILSSGRMRENYSLLALQSEK